MECYLLVSFLSRRLSKRNLTRLVKIPIRSISFLTKSKIKNNLSTIHLDPMSSTALEKITSKDEWKPILKFWNYGVLLLSQIIDSYPTKCKNTYTSISLQFSYNEKNSSLDFYLADSLLIGEIFAYSYKIDGKLILLQNITNESIASVRQITNEKALIYFENRLNLLEVEQMSCFKILRLIDLSILQSYYPNINAAFRSVLLIQDISNVYINKSGTDFFERLPLKPISYEYNGKIVTFTRDIFKSPYMDQFAFGSSYFCFLSDDCLQIYRKRRHKLIFNSEAKNELKHKPSFLDIFSWGRNKELIILQTDKTSIRFYLVSKSQISNLRTFQLQEYNPRYVNFAVKTKKGISLHLSTSQSIFNKIARLY
jgi:hypothetical protein